MDTNETATRLRHPGRPMTEAVEADKHWKLLCDAAANKNAAEAQLRDAVQQARAANVSWFQIGEALGMSKQAAWERYKHVESLTREWDWDAHKGGPEGHLATCASSGCKHPAKYHVRWGFGCGNLCGVHERQFVKRGMGGTHSSGIIDIYDPGSAN